MRLARALVLPVMVIAVAACGSSGGTDAAGSTQPSVDAPASPSPADASPAASQDDGGAGASSGGGAGDLSGVADQLVPPNASETSKTTASGVIFVTYSSSESPDSLKSFYESAIGKIGWHTLSTTSAEGSYSWVISPDASGNAAGSITVAPDASGGSGSQVLIQLGAGG